MSDFNKVIDFLTEMNFRLDLDANADRFRKKAYLNAAEALREAGTLEDISSIKGIGKSIKADIDEVIAGQTPSRLLEMRKNGPPASVIGLTKIRGIGPKGAVKLSQQGITSIEALEKAIHEHRITDAKLIANYYASITASDRIRRDYVAAAVAPILKFLMDHKLVINAACMGSFRRHRPDVRDVDVLVTVEKGSSVAAIVKDLAQHLGVTVRTEGPRKSYMDLMVAGEARNLDLNFCLKKEEGCAVAHFTGSKDFNVKCRQIAESKGLKVNQYAITDSKGVEHFCETEHDFFEFLGLPYVPPECRDTFLFQTPELPSIIEESEIVGDFHTHTTASDGSVKPEQMLKAAKDYGYKCVGISDHSKATGRGLEEEDAVKRSRFLKANATKLPGIRMFSGVELDVRMDGTLDYNIDSLSNFDYVILATHIHCDKDIDIRITAAVNAIRKKHPKLPLAWAHPTGRIIGSRVEASIDYGTIFKYLASNKVAIEINGQPSRLDLPSSKAVTAKRMGCKFILSSDCHTTSLEIMNNAVMLARRALLTRSDIINASVGGVKAWLTGKI
jgi:DNA polymerase (family 10)